MRLIPFGLSHHHLYPGNPPKGHKMNVKAGENNLYSKEEKKIWIGHTGKLQCGC